MDRIVVKEIKKYSKKGGTKEYRANRGDLIMIDNSTQSEGFVVGVYAEVRAGKLYLDSPLVLRPCCQFGGQEIPFVHRHLHPEQMVWQINNPRRNLELVVGQDKIAEALSSKERYKKHADWVAKLRRPYLR
jgi:hypothetical protein